MPKDTMTPRERWLAVLNRQTPDRVPMDYWATDEATERLMAYLHCESEQALFEHLHIDKVISVGPYYSGAPVSVYDTGGYYVGPSLPDDADVFGCRYRQVDYGAGTYWECVYHPLAQYDTIEEIKRNYRWPGPDWWDYSALPDQVTAYEEYPIQGGGSEPFLNYKNLRGQEQAFMDLVLHPEMVHFCLDRLFDLCYQNTLRIYEQLPGRVMITYVAEDFGGQEDLMYSPAQIREFFVPRMRRLMELAHEAGAFVFHHTDGASRKIIPDMVEAGIDVLNPIQWRCKGMEREALKRDFGDRLIFHGGVDNQYTLAFGSVEDVREEVMDNLRILGEGGGYILAPCHNIQAVSPPRNIVTMYGAGYECGWCS
jgi:uroporphyrinogen decarboxylase